MTKPATALLLVTLSAAGCGDAGTPLAQLAPSALDVNVSNDKVTARVSWAAPLEGQPCLGARRDLRATFEGKSLSLVSAGGQIEVLGGTRCDSVAELELVTPTDFTQARAKSDVTITDGSTTLTASFANLVALRALAPVDETVTAGQKARFALTPATDTLTSAEKLQWLLPTGPRGATGVVLEGNALSTDVPVDAKPGDTLVLSWGRGEGLTTAQATTCTGVATCTASAQVQPQAAMVRVQ